MLSDMGTELRRLKPETITRALVALRAELIREGGPGLDHVEALLQMRGNNLPPVPCKATVRFRRGKLRVAIYAALRGGPLTGREIVERVCVAHGLAYRALYRSVYAQLWCLKDTGRVAHEGRVWKHLDLGSALSHGAKLDSFGGKVGKVSPVRDPESG